MATSKFQTAFATAAALTFSACDDSVGIVIPVDHGFAVTVSGAVLETGFDDATQDWWCRVELVASATGGEPETQAQWHESQYEFRHLDGQTWTDVWTVEQIAERFGASHINSGETQTSIRRFYSSKMFDVALNLRYALPGAAEASTASVEFNCF